MAVSKAKILDAISEMTVMTVVDLISDMEEKCGGTAAAPVAMAAAPAAGGPAGRRLGGPPIGTSALEGRLLRQRVVGDEAEHLVRSEAQRHAASKRS